MVNEHMLENIDEQETAYPEAERLNESKKSRMAIAGERSEPSKDTIDEQETAHDKRDQWERSY